VIAAFVGAGATTQAYFATYVTTAELETRLAGRTAQVERLQDQIRQLREADAAQARDVEAIKELAAETRADVKRLLQHMLENPPERRR
jgi:adenylosuccinate lyase